MNYKEAFISSTNERENVIIEHSTRRIGATLKITATVTLSADSKKTQRIIKEAIDKQKSPIELILKEVDKNGVERVYAGHIPHYVVNADVWDIIHSID